MTLYEEIFGCDANSPLCRLTNYGSQTLEKRSGSQGRTKTPSEYVSLSSGNDNDDDDSNNNGTRWDEEEVCKEVFHEAYSPRHDGGRHGDGVRSSLPSTSLIAFHSAVTKRRVCFTQNGVTCVQFRFTCIKQH